MWLNLLHRSVTLSHVFTGKGTKVFLQYIMMVVTGDDESLFIDGFPMVKISRIVFPLFGYSLTQGR